MNSSFVMVLGLYETFLQLKKNHPIEKSTFLHCRGKMNVFKMIEWTMFICLFIVSIYFMWDVMNKYNSKDTSFKQYKKNLTQYPTIVFSFHPWRYEYGVDFDIIIDQHHKLSLGNTSIDDNILALKPVETIYGNYFKLKKIPQFQGIKPTKFNIMFKFNQSIPKEQLPLTKLYITSEENSYGIAVFNWLDGEALVYDAKPETMTEIILKGEQMLLLPEKGECQENSAYYCVASFIQTFDCQKCSKRCISQPLYDNLRPFYSNSHTEICQKASDVDCFLEYCAKNGIITKLVETGLCQQSCSTIEFSGKLVYEGQVPGLDMNHTTYFSYSIKAPATMRVNEEYLIYDFVGLVGSVGGTLGMFIGFSFMNVISDVLIYIKSLLEKKKLEIW